MKRKIILNQDKIILEELNLNFETLALDTETTSLRYDTQELIGISLCDGNTAIFCEYPLCKELLNQVQNYTKVLICHNITFDMKMLYKVGYSFFDKEWVDTMIMAHLLDEEREHGLKYLAKNLLGKDVVEYSEAVKNKDKFYAYAIDDAIYTWELAEIFKGQLVNENLTKLFRGIEMPFLKVLTKMELNGVLIDKNKVNVITTELQELIRELEIKMLESINQRYELQYDLVGNIKVLSPINFNSTDQVGEILFKKLGLKPVTTTESGKNSIGKATISQLSKEHIFVEYLAKYKEAQKLLNAFFLPMSDYIDSDGRIRPHFNDAGTATGRLSCSQPNLQQLPKENKSLGIDTRSCFISPEGKKIISIDYSQQELRIMAQLSKDEKLIKIINEGGDLHLINANNVFNLGIPEEKLYESHPEYKEVKSAFKKDRDNGKIFSFGVSYGMGEHKLSRDFKVSIDEAKVLLQRFFQGFPGLEKSIKETHQKSEKDLFVATYTGRRRRFKINQWGKLDSKALRQSFNFLIQSLGADLIRVACIKLDKFAEVNPKYSIKLIMTIHDEIVLECKEEYADEVGKACAEILKSCATGFVCPLQAEYGIGNSYGAAK
jgi:DNA polymerase-1